MIHMLMIFTGLLLGGLSAGLFYAASRSADGLSVILLGVAGIVAGFYALQLILKGLRDFMLEPVIDVLNRIAEK